MAKNDSITNAISDLASGTIKGGGSMVRVASNLMNTVAKTVDETIDKSVGKKKKKKKVEIIEDNNEYMWKLTKNSGAMFISKKFADREKCESNAKKAGFKIKKEEAGNAGN